MLRGILVALHEQLLCWNILALTVLRGQQADSKGAVREWLW
jgi:hypothetical protein